MADKENTPQEYDEVGEEITVDDAQETTAEAVPEEVAEPEVAAVPEEVAEPEVVPEPQVVAEPEIADEPEVAAVAEERADTPEVEVETASRTDTPDNVPTPVDAANSVTVSEQEESSLYGEDVMFGDSTEAPARDSSIVLLSTQGSLATKASKKSASMKSSGTQKSSTGSKDVVNAAAAPKAKAKCAVGVCCYCSRKKRPATPCPARKKKKKASYVWGPPKSGSRPSFKEVCPHEYAKQKEESKKEKDGANGESVKNEDKKSEMGRQERQGLLAQPTKRKWYQSDHAEEKLVRYKRRKTSNRTVELAHPKMTNVKGTLDTQRNNLSKEMEERLCKMLIEDFQMDPEEIDCFMKTGKRTRKSGRRSKHVSKSRKRKFSQRDWFLSLIAQMADVATALKDLQVTPGEKDDNIGWMQEMIYAIADQATENAEANKPVLGELVNLIIESLAEVLGERPPSADAASTLAQMMTCAAERVSVWIEEVLHEANKLAIEDQGDFRGASMVEEEEVKQEGERVTPCPVHGDVTSCAIHNCDLENACSSPSRRKKKSRGRKGMKSRKGKGKKKVKDEGEIASDGDKKEAEDEDEELCQCACACEPPAKKKSKKKKKAKSGEEEDTLVNRSKQTSPTRSPKKSADNGKKEEGKKAKENAAKDESKTQKEKKENTPVNGEDGDGSSNQTKQPASSDKVTEKPAENEDEDGSPNEANKPASTEQVKESPTEDADETGSSNKNAEAAPGIGGETPSEQKPPPRDDPESLNDEKGAEESTDPQSRTPPGEERQGDPEASNNENGAEETMPPGEETQGEAQDTDTSQDEKKEDSSSPTDGVQPSESRITEKAEVEIDDLSEKAKNVLDDGKIGTEDGQQPQDVKHVIFEMLSTMIENVPEKDLTDKRSKLAKTLDDKISEMIKIEDKAGAETSDEERKEAITVVADKMATWMQEIMETAAARTSSVDVPVSAKRRPSKVTSQDLRQWSEWMDKGMTEASDWAQWISKTVAAAEDKAAKKKGGMTTESGTAVKLTRKEWEQWKADLKKDVIDLRMKKKALAEQAHEWKLRTQGKPFVGEGSPGVSAVSGTSPVTPVTASEVSPTSDVRPPDTDEGSEGVNVSATPDVSPATPKDIPTPTESPTPNDTSAPQESVVPESSPPPEESLEDEGSPGASPVSEVPSVNPATIPEVSSDVRPPNTEQGSEGADESAAPDASNAISEDSPAPVENPDPEESVEGQGATEDSRVSES